MGTLQEVLRPAVELVDLQFSGLGPGGAEALGALSVEYPGLRVIVKGAVTLVSAPGWEAAERAEQVSREQGGRLVSLAQQRETLEEFFLREINREGQP